MPHSFSHAVSMNLEHSIKEGSHERYPDHFQCIRNIKKIKYPDFQAMTNILSRSTETKNTILFHHFRTMAGSQHNASGMISKNNIPHLNFSNI